MDQIAGLTWCQLPRPIRHSLAPLGPAKGALILAIAAAILPIYPVPSTIFVAALWFGVASFIVYYFLGGGEHISKVKCPHGKPEEVNEINYMSTLRFFFVSTYSVVGGLFIFMTVMALISLIKNPEKIYVLQRNLATDAAREKATHPGILGFFGAFQTVYEWLLIDLVKNRSNAMTIFLVALAILIAIGVLVFVLVRVAAKKSYTCPNGGMPTIEKSTYDIEAMIWATANTLSYLGYYMVYFIPMTLTMWGSYYSFMTDTQKANARCQTVGVSQKSVKQRAMNIVEAQNTPQEELAREKASLMNLPQNKKMMQNSNSNSPPSYEESQKNYSQIKQV